MSYVAARGPRCWRLFALPGKLKCAGIKGTWRSAGVIHNSVALSLRCCCCETRGERMFSLKKKTCFSRPY